MLLIKCSRFLPTGQATGQAVAPKNEMINIEFLWARLPVLIIRREAYYTIVV